MIGDFLNHNNKDAVIYNTVEVESIIFKIYTIRKVNEIDRFRIPRALMANKKYSK
jgi:hypothetical protein